ncbi:MAG TPA: HEAT repeat domain-containing protein, partial [Pirellulales bacterium]
EVMIIQRLTDEDHLVRAEAAKALVQATSNTARQALLIACHDRSVVVQEAAQQSLETMARASGAGEQAGTPAVQPAPSPLNHSGVRDSSLLNALAIAPGISGLTMN